MSGSAYLNPRSYAGTRMVPWFEMIQHVLRQCGKGGAIVKGLPLIGLLAACALALAPVAAQAAPDEHFFEVGSVVDPDFCGTGETVAISFNVHVNLWLMPGGEDFSKLTQSGKGWFTNPTTGRRSRLPLPVTSLT
jgi:hypothetical protein